MVTTSRDIGTLIVVILKARNLPNKRHIGKQDPYCTVTLNGEKRRTKAIRRGGQHPEWDEEVRFTLFEDPDDESTRIVHGDGTPPPPPPKSNGKGPPNIKGGRSMDVACYADDPREPDLIGETKVDLTEVLTKGETDEWFTLMNKDKYCGEVYLELTFWSNEPEPVKKSTSKPKAQKQYGGPGSFVPAGESSSYNGFDGQHVIARHTSTGDMREELRQDNIPPSLRASSSLAQLDLYVPPYQTSRSRHSVVDTMANDFAEMGVTSNESRRQSFPSRHSGYLPRPASSVGYADPQGLAIQPAHGFHHSTYSEGGASYSYTPDVPVQSTGTSATMSYHQSTMSVNHDAYQPPYETGYQAPVRHAGPRHSIPAASSGFMPMPTPAPSGFVPLSSYPSQQGGFAPPPSLTPAPTGYGPPLSHSPVPSSSFTIVPQSSGAPSGFTNSGTPPSSTSYHQSLPQPPQQPSTYSYQQYAPSPPSTLPQQPPPPPPPASAPTYPQAPQHSYAPMPTPSVPPPSHSAPPEQYSSYESTPPPSHEYIPPPPPLNESPPSGQPSGSRPLPQPMQQIGRRQSSLPVPPSGGPPGMYNPPSRGPSGTFSPPLVGQPGQYTPPSQGAPPSGYSTPMNQLMRAPSGSYNPAGSQQSNLYTHATGGPTGSYNPQPGQPGPYNSLSTSDSNGNVYNSIPPPPPLPRASVSPAPYPPNGQSLGPSPSQSLPPSSSQYQQGPVQNSSAALPPTQYHQPPVQRSPGLPSPAHYQQPPAQSSPALLPMVQYQQPPAQSSPALPPPPPTVSRRPSLPPPPTMGYSNQPQSAYQALPPPPPPPNMPPNAQYEPISSFPSSSHSQTFHPGPPPRPPAQLNTQQQYMSPPVNQQPYGGFSPIAEKGW